LVIFPLYYPPKLSRDEVIDCYLESIEISCFVTKDWTLEIKFFKVPIKKETPILLTIVGAT